MSRIVPAPIIGQSAASGAQVIDGSLKFDGSKSTALKRTPSSDGNKKTWTWSAWVKKHKDSRSTLFSAGATSSDTGFAAIEIESDEQLRYSGWNTLWKRSNDKFRDYSEFYHIVVAFDVTQATASDRVRLYKNGVEITNLANNSSLSNVDYPINDNVIHYIGGIDGGGGENLTFSDYNMTQVYLIDGLALGPESFGFTDPLTGTWRPKKYTGSFTQSAINDGTVWTSKHSGTVYGGSVANVFDTDLTNRAEINSSDSNNNHFTISSINLSSASSVGVYVSHSGSDVEVSVNDTVVGTIASGSITTSSQLFSFSFTETTVTSIKVRRVGSTSGWYLYGILVNSTQLIDGANHTGVNSFYLPMDGNSPIGQDKSGNGNDWTPVNFGGSVSLDNPTASGALPILNTTQGGTQATVGVRTDVYATSTNDGTVWSNYLSSTGALGYQTNGFNGDLSVGAYSSDSSPITFTPPSTIHFQTLRVYTGTGSGTNVANINGGSNIVLNNNAWTTISETGGSFSTLTVDNTTGNGTRINAIEVNGYILKDSTSSGEGLVLALPLVGSTNDVSNQINSGSTTKVVTANGDAAASNEQSNFYSGSFEFDGTGDTLTSAQSSDLTMGTADFTVECWARQKDTSHRGIWQISNTSGGLEQSSYGTTIAVGARGTDWQIYGAGSSTESSTYPIASGIWYHLAYVRSSGTSKLYVNGTEVLSKSSDTTDYNGTYLVIGGYYNSSYLYNGYIQDFRVYKGVAKYTSNFVVPSRSPDILPDTPSGVSGSSKLTKITDGAVLFGGANSGDELNINDSSDFHLSNNDFTMECFIYQNAAAHAQGNGIHGHWNIGGGPSDNGYLIWVDTNQKFGYYDSSDGVNGELNLQSAANTISLNRWHHVAATRNGNTFRIFVDGIQVGSTTSSHTINDATTTYKIGAWASTDSNFPGFISNVRLVNGTALYTSNFTPPTRALTNVTNTKLLCCQSNTLAGSAAVAPSISGLNDGRVWSSGSTTGSVYASDNDWNNVFNGVAGNDKAIAANDATYEITLPGGGISGVTKVEIYGQQQSGAANATITLSSAGEQSVAQGTSLGYTTFYTGSSDTLTKLKVASTSSNRSSINAVRINDTTILTDPLANSVGANPGATATNFTPFNTDINTVRGQETGYATWNPLENNLTLSNGNLSVTSSGGNRGTRSNIAVSSGKWFWEYTVGSVVTNCYVGVTQYLDSSGLSGNNYVLHGTGGNNYNNNTGGSWSIINADFTTGMIIGCAFDYDGGNIYIYKDGALAATFSGGNFAQHGDWKAHISFNAAVTTSWETSFGQKPFKFPPPDGFQPLNAANVRPETVITRPQEYFNTTLWSGNNADPRQIDLGMAPDLIWVKTRNQTNWHWLSDSLRGTADKRYKLYSNDTTAQDTAPIYGQADSFNDFGFVAGGGTHNTNPLSDVNQVGTNYVCWSWKAGGNKNTFNVDDVGYASAAAAGLDGGTYTPTGASIGTKQGFSIIKYTGSASTGTFSHGLSQAPDFMICKRNASGPDWVIYHRSMGSNKVLYFTNADAATSTAAWNNTNPTSSLVHVGNSGDTNSSDSQIYYIWHDVPGLQKFGRYVGNGTTNGPYVELGFKPALLVVKNADTGGTSRNWAIIDSTRSYANVGNHTLAWNLNSAESSFGGGESVFGASNKIDLLSSGFKIRDSGVFGNESGQIYIYCAWAEAPAFNLFGGQSNAR